MKHKIQTPIHKNQPYTSNEQLETEILKVPM